MGILGWAAGGTVFGVAAGAPLGGVGSAVGALAGFITMLMAGIVWAIVQAVVEENKAIAELITNMSRQLGTLSGAAPVIPTDEDLTHTTPWPGN
ncbi:hypothetical protein [Natronoglycomyces albus]|uniref:Uncharacterized protein n=1 Tax=Natronoglycomyces albus TaxID=2811108 RepID=A0A895XPY2_9ACTN|nr:hypothetical protein [Natronoglycomyces albus]QSB05429.1 hypothetical protein JQS30_00330 [Natronoglycomyces albus]